MTTPIIPSNHPNNHSPVIKGMFSVTIAPGAVSAGSTVLVTPTVPGTCKADLGDIVLVGAGADLGGVMVTGYVSAANTIKVVFNNNTGGGVTPASSTYNIIVIAGESGKFVA